MYDGNRIEDPNDERLAAFLADLTELSRRHGIAIAGCGCCDSPFCVEDFADDAYYRMHPGGSRQVQWVDPASICRGCEQAMPRPEDNLEDGLCSLCYREAHSGTGSQNVRQPSV